MSIVVPGQIIPGPGGINLKFAGLTRHGQVQGVVELLSANQQRERRLKLTHLQQHCRLLHQSAGLSVVPLIGVGLVGVQRRISHLARPLQVVLFGIEPRERQKGKCSLHASHMPKYRLLLSQTQVVHSLSAVSPVGVHITDYYQFPHIHLMVEILE